MIKIIYGAKGSGKTKNIIDTANAAVADAKGHLIFITDTNRRHLDETVASLGATGDCRLWQVERGTFTPIQA